MFMCSLNFFTIEFFTLDLLKIYHFQTTGMVSSTVHCIIQNTCTLEWLVVLYIV